MKSDLTKGKIVKPLIIFSIPIILGNIIQQMYSMVDLFLVGKFIGPDALSAVGSSCAVIVLITSIILGLAMGSSVVFSFFYGAKRQEEMKISIFNAFVFISIVSIGIIVLFFLFTNKTVQWMNLEGIAGKYMKEYLIIIYSGMIFVVIYNFLAAIMRSIGNTKVPLIFVTISAILNIVLDIFFMGILKMEVKGAAIATILSQGISAVTMILYVINKGKDIMPTSRHFVLKKDMLRMIIENSFLTAVQQSIMNFGILLVHGLVNSFGMYASAAFAIVVKIDSFAYMPAQDFGTAFTTYIAQNYGARNNKRITEGCKKAFIISAIFCSIMAIFIIIFAKNLVTIFVSENQKEIITIAVGYLHIVGSTYVGIGVLFLLYAIYRGIGKSQISILLTIISLGTRVVLAYILSANDSIGLTGIWIAIPIGWILADIVGLVIYRKLFIKNNKIHDLLNVD